MFYLKFETLGDIIRGIKFHFLQLVIANTGCHNPDNAEGSSIIYNNVCGQSATTSSFYTRFYAIAEQRGLHATQVAYGN